MEKQRKTRKGKSIVELVAERAQWWTNMEVRQNNLLASTADDRQKKLNELNNEFHEGERRWCRRINQALARARVVAT